MRQALDIGGRLMRTTKVNTEVAQYLMRQSFEEGFRAAGGSGKSRLNPSKGKWFDYWVQSKTRAMLIANGVITGQEGYK